MWAKRIVTAIHKVSREIREFEIGCMAETEALVFGRIWFPPEQYEGHRIGRKC